MNPNPLLRFFSLPIAILTFFCLFLALAESAFCRTGPPVSETIRVGVVDAPPVYMKNEKGEWEGLGVEIWQMVARRMGASFELLEYDEFGSMLEALENGKLDAIPCIPAELRRLLRDSRLGKWQRASRTGQPCLAAADENRGLAPIDESICTRTPLKEESAMFGSYHRWIFPALIAVDCAP